MRIRSLIPAAALAITALAGGVAPQVANAEADHSQTLRHICEAKGGDIFVTPFTRARCQFTRPSNGADDGLRAARVICTMQMGGEFRSAPSFGTDGTMTWTCI